MNKEVVREINKKEEWDITSIDTEQIKPTDRQDYKCAPHLKFETGSCISLDLLIKMVEAYNKHNSKDQIKLHPRLESLNQHKYKKYLLKHIKDIFKDKCKSQTCWLNQPFMKELDEFNKDQLQRFTFRPLAPEGQFKWLNTININEVMEQYERVYPEYKFLGAVPMDFDKVKSLGIADMNLDEFLKDNIYKLGIIFNLDEHWQPGSHWVAGYIDIKKGLTYYFDSYGYPPESRVSKLFRRCSKFSEDKLGVKADAKYNKVRHQRGNSECGMFSINFILRLLEGDNFDDICNNIIKDDSVNKMRLKVFRDAEKFFPEKIVNEGFVKDKMSVFQK